LPHHIVNYFEILPMLRPNCLRLIDLRSPAEFKLGAMSLAINLPLFSDEERAKVGILYKQVGKLEATQVGLEIVASKIPWLMDQLLQHAGNNQQLAVHCWRGGMRSQAITPLLSSIGIKPYLIEGGYKSYRRQVLTLIDQISTHKLLVLNGRTDTGKTKMLRELKDAGVPAIDFEALASHRGSALGDFNLQSPQPTQQNFENLLANDYESVKSNPTILIEIEQDIGTIRMPHQLQRYIYASPMILLDRTLMDRITHLELEYTAGWDTAKNALFRDRMALLKKHLQGPIYTEILANIETKNFKDAIKLLLIHRYDRCYDKAIARQKNQVIAKYDVSVSLERYQISNLKTAYLTIGHHQF
jgi:tRNA 2-selenouridine synthase